MVLRRFLTFLTTLFRLGMASVGTLVTVAVLLLTVAPVQQAHASLIRGFADDVWFDGVNTGGWIRKTEATGARRVLIEVDWLGLQPTRPPSGANLTDSAGPAFNQNAMAELDFRIKEFLGTGLQPALLITDAPRWAQGRGGTAAQYATGGYKPNAQALGHLAQALASRYSGSFPDPTQPRQKLPRVTYFQAWAEAAFSIHLSPQWTRSHGNWVNSGALIYRSMLNRFYAGIKRGNPHAIVISSGLAAYGDRPGGQRTHPITFLENLFCLNNRLHRVCHHPVHFDILAADPYEDGAPTIHAFSGLDASAPDLGRMMRVVRAGLKQRTVFPDRAKRLWVTEFGYDSNPPNPAAVSLSTQAHWLEQSLYIFWTEHVQTVMWYLVRDQAPPYTINYASGVYFRNGRRKPSFTAYHFPFVVMRSGTHAQIWGIAPAHGVVKVQHKVHGRWRVVARFGRRSGAVFARKIPRNLSGSYRAVQDRQHSLIWNYH